MVQVGLLCSSLESSAQHVSLIRPRGDIADNAKHFLSPSRSHMVVSRSPVERYFILRLPTAGRSGHMIVTDDAFVSDAALEFGFVHVDRRTNRVPPSDGVTICPEELRRGRPGEIPSQNQNSKGKETSLAHYIYGNLRAIGR
jgi:hypothetical protein